MAVFCELCIDLAETGGTMCHSCMCDHIAELEKENKRLQKLIIDAIARNERLLAVNAEYKRQAIE